MEGMYFSYIEVNKMKKTSNISWYIKTIKKTI